MIGSPTVQSSVLGKGADPPSPGHLFVHVKRCRSVATRSPFRLLPRNGSVPGKFQAVHATALDATRRATAALLCLAVSVVHVIDQDGIPGSKDPSYVGVHGWLLAVSLAAGPLAGYILSRGPGLPNYTDDKGNRNKPLGVVSLIVEGFLLILSLMQLLAARKPSNTTA